ncbi:HNH endonuclease [Microbacterium sp. NPDC080220]|uniref:HNH endonuclease n=1 Tax=Microbacterium sp. NPDC080220 TaxID=3161017 RepID=UPI003415BE30
MRVAECSACGRPTSPEGFAKGRRQCRACVAARAAERGARWRAANPERVKEKHQREYRSNREAILARQRKRRADDPSAQSAYARKHYLANRETILASARDRRAASPDVFAERSRAYRQRNPEVVAEASRRYHARRRGASVVEPGVTWRAVAERDGMTCFYCGLMCDAADGRYVNSIDGHRRWVCGPLHPTLDHIVPVSLGGHHSMTNAVLSCRRCNQRKGAGKGAS